MMRYLISNLLFSILLLCSIGLSHSILAKELDTDVISYKQPAIDLYDENIKFLETVNASELPKPKYTETNKSKKGYIGINYKKKIVFIKTRQVRIPIKPCPEGSEISPMAADSRNAGENAGGSGGGGGCRPILENENDDN